MKILIELSTTDQILLQNALEHYESNPYACRALVSDLRKLRQKFASGMQHATAVFTDRDFMRSHHAETHYHD